jgi:hypothetical protein
MSDQSFFMEPPTIASKDSRYFIRFRYAGHYYLTVYTKTQSDTIIFYIPLNTSTGNAQGKLHLQEIKIPAQIALIKKGWVFWENPGKKLLPMKIETLKEDINSKEVIKGRDF